MTSEPLEDMPDVRVVEQAAEWAAQLDSDQVTPAQQTACENWCGESPMHRLALDRMRGFDVRFQALDGLHRRTLRHALTRGVKAKRLRRTALGIVMIVAAGLTAAPFFKTSEPSAGYRTAVGEQRTLSLADGSQLIMDTNGILNVADRSGRRAIELVQGQILAKVARNPKRPFVVETVHGTATALGTAFIVRRQEQDTVVTVLESRVRVCPAHQSQSVCTDLRPGERARISQAGVTKLASVNVDAAAAWSKGWIEADNTPLVELLDQMNRYRIRPIRFDRAVLGAVRITGSYPLTDAGRALGAMAQTAGLRVVRSPDGDLQVARQ